MSSPNNYVCVYAHIFSFFFNGTATTEIYTFPYTTLFRSHGARRFCLALASRESPRAIRKKATFGERSNRSEEHTSELQSRLHLVCRLLLEKKKNKKR